MNDPYNSIGRDYYQEIYAAGISGMAQAASDAVRNIIRRWESQELEPGYDPYNNQRQRFTFQTFVDWGTLRADSPTQHEEAMTTRLEAARAAVHTAVRMYAPVHVSFSDEATRRLNVALAEVEAAAVEAAKPAAPPVPPIDSGPAPDLVKLNEPAQAQPGAIGGMSAPDPVELPPAEVETAPPVPPAGKKPRK